MIGANIYIGHKIVDYCVSICGRKNGYITTVERIKARKRNRK